MADLFKDIQEFHEKFGLMYDGSPRQLEGELLDFRIKFMEEELTEYVAGIYDKDLEQQFDALIDLVYVALGTALLQGFNFNEGWRRVHEANMKKIRAERADQSKRGTAFDVVKPENWSPPDLSDLVK